MPRPLAGPVSGSDTPMVMSAIAAPDTAHSAALASRVFRSGLLAFSCVSCVLCVVMSSSGVR